MNKFGSFFKKKKFRFENEIKIACANIEKILAWLKGKLKIDEGRYLKKKFRYVLIIIIVIITSTVGYGLYIKVEYGRLYKNLGDSLDQFDSIETNFEKEFIKADEISRSAADMMKKKAFSKDATMIQTALKQEYEVRGLMKKVRPIIREVRTRIMKKYGWILLLW